MTLETYILNLFQQVGIPATMIIWFMTRTERVIQRNTDAFNKFCIIQEKKK